MNRMKQHILAGLCLCTVLGGCINLKQPHYDISFYTLEYPPVRTGDLGDLPVVLKVAPFGVAPAYDTHRIVFRKAPFRRDTYPYHRWRSDPGDLVSDRLRRDLATGALFAAVITSDNNLPADYRLTGTVDEFLEWGENKKREAVLSISITLSGEDPSAMERVVLLHRAYRANRPIEGTDPPSLVKAMSQAMAELSLQVMTDVHRYIRQREAVTD